MEKDILSDFKNNSLKDLLAYKKAAKSEYYLEATEKELKIPLLMIMATDLNGKKELIDRDLLFQILEGCRVLNLKTIVIDSQQKSETHDLLKNHVTWINPLTDFDGDGAVGPKEVDKLFLAADMALVFHNQIELIQLMASYGVVMIGEEKTPLLENYKPNEESGNSFTYTNRDAWGVFAAIVRAAETYKFPFDWNNIVRNLIR